MPNFGTKLFNIFNVYSFLCTKIGTEGGSRTHTLSPTLASQTSASTIPPLRYKLKVAGR